MDPEHARPSGRPKITKAQFLAGAGRAAFARPGPGGAAAPPAGNPGPGRPMAPSQALAAFKRYARRWGCRGGWWTWSTP